MSNMNDFNGDKTSKERFKIRKEAKEAIKAFDDSFNRAMRLANPEPSKFAYEWTEAGFLVECEEFLAVVSKLGMVKSLPRVGFKQRGAFQVKDLVAIIDDLYFLYAEYWDAKIEYNKLPISTVAIKDGMPIEKDCLGRGGLWDLAKEIRQAVDDEARLGSLPYTTTIYDVLVKYKVD